MLRRTCKRLLSPRTRRSDRRLGFEPLEQRLAMDAALPQLVDDRFDAWQNGPATQLDVLKNDEFGIDYAGQRRITAVSYGSQGGRIEIAADAQTVRYAPPADFSGTETFVYYVDEQYSATVSVVIESPLLTDTYYFVPDSTRQTLDVLANDRFWEGYEGPRQITSVSTSSLGGEVAISADRRSLIYTLPEDGLDASFYSSGADATDSLVYVVDDVYSARVQISFPLPLRYDEVPNLVQNSETNVLDVLANDPFWPAYAGAKKITRVHGVSSGGSVAIADEGRSLRYTPAADFAGSETFVYVVDDAYEATARVQVNRPVQDDRFELDLNSREQFLELTGNDYFEYWQSVGVWQMQRVDVVDRVTSVGPTSQGGTVAVSADGRGVVYTAPEGFSGTDTFEYVADEKYRATVSIQLTRPVRDDAIYNLVYEGTVDNRLPVLDNDFLGNQYGGARIITSVSTTAAGATVAIAADGHSLLYTPAIGFRGSDSFTYTVDGALDARVSVAVDSLLVGDSYSYWPQYAGTEYVLAVLDNDHLDSQYPGPGVITAVSQTDKGGQASISADGHRIRFQPAADGWDRFTYTVDGQYEATVSVWLNERLRSDSFVVDQNSSRNELRPLENDFPDDSSHWDPAWMRYDGPRQITAAGPTAHGGAVEIVNGLVLAYTPAADFAGEDQFTYTVDGFLQTTVTVHVVRRVRDDLFRVGLNGNAEQLPVLLNDLFGADYAGAGKITAVTAPASGATAQVSADGAAILYTPASGFVGEDAFVYTVDGTLKATVTVAVSDSAEQVLPRFGTLSEFQQFLLDDARQRYADRFGQEAYKYPTFLEFGDAIQLGSDTAKTVVSERSYSETNVQVAGVDEADLIETDGEYLYILRGSELLIANAWPADELSLVSRRQVRGSALGQYLYGDRLTVVSQVLDEGPIWLFDSARSAVASATSSRYYDWPYPARSATTVVTVFDVSDPSAPVLVQKTELDGEYVESRRLDEHVFVVLRNDQIGLPEPEKICNTDAGAIPEPSDSYGLIRYQPPTPCVYETEEQYLERVQSQWGRFLDEDLPHYASYGPDGDLVRTGLLTAPEDMYRPLTDDARSLVTVVSLDVTSNEPGLGAASGILAAGGSEIYGSLDNLYVFDKGATAEDSPVTRIMKFRWDRNDGGVQFVAQGQVAGSMINQFSADEQGDDLRIATTISHAWTGNWSGRSENALFVLREDGGVLEFVGSLQNLALDENIRSVRFLGDRAFVTTFRQVDPLFALDLRDSAAPRAVGHITMPGFNSYMQLVDANHILAVGRNTPNGIAGPTQVALFDVSDLSRPRLVEQFTFPRFSSSEAELDHHAFGWFAEHHVLAVPSTGGVWERLDNDGDGYREARVWKQADKLAVFRIDADAVPRSGGGVQWLGEIEHDSAVRRSAFIDDVLYSIATESVVAANIQNPSQVYSELRLPELVTDPPVVDPVLSDSPDSTEMGPLELNHVPQSPETRQVRTARQACEALAARLGTSADAPLLVAMEWPGPASATAQIVLAVGNSQYRYEAAGEAAPLLAEEQFVFGSGEAVDTWHNASLREDVNTDANVTTLDALVIVNALNNDGPRRLESDQVLRQVRPVNSAPDGGYRWDVNGDGCLTALDALLVINRLNGQI